MRNTQLSLKSGKLSITRKIPGEAARLWTILTDTALWPQWGPSVRAVQCSSQYIEGGSTGRVQTAAGIWLPFTVTEYRAQHYWNWRVCGIKATGHSITSSHGGTCSVAFTMPWWSAPYVLACHIALCRIERIAHHQSSSGASHQ